MENENCNPAQARRLPAFKKQKKKETDEKRKPILQCLVQENVLKKLHKRDQIRRKEQDVTDGVVLLEEGLIFNLHD